jgi:hypothetical protein
MLGDLGRKPANPGKLQTAEVTTLSASHADLLNAQENYPNAGDQSDDRSPAAGKIEEASPPEKSGLQRKREWATTPYGLFFRQKFRNSNERRKIIAFVFVAAFLLFTFWNSIAQKRLENDIDRAIVEKTISSGRILPD